MDFLADGLTVGGVHLSPRVLMAIVVIVLSLIVSVASKPTGNAMKVAELKAARALVLKLLQERACHPVLVRLAWHDAGTYDAAVQSWPECGGANGSIRFSRELSHGANAGLAKAVEFLRPIKEAFKTLSWADLLQLASATAIEDAGGPRIPMRYGRVDVKAEDECPAEGNLPAANGPFPDGAPNAQTHLRNVFFRMGLSNLDICALSGAHTLGRAFQDRSGTVPEPSGHQGTRHTGADAVPDSAGTAARKFMPGGRSWTPKWLVFDNSYFKVAVERAEAEELLRLETDKCLSIDPEFRPFYEKYAKSQEAFFADYATSHARLSELGSKFEPPEGLRID